MKGFYVMIILYVPNLKLLWLYKLSSKLYSQYIEWDINTDKVFVWQVENLLCNEPRIVRMDNSLSQ
jgi:hypothetical protein